VGNFPHTHTQKINVAQIELYSFSPSERKNHQEGLLLVLHMLASCAFKTDKQKQSPRRRHRVTSDGCRGLLNISSVLGKQSIIYAISGLNQWAFQNYTLQVKISNFV